MTIVFDSMMNPIVTKIVFSDWGIVATQVAATQILAIIIVNMVPNRFLFISFS
jgi:hypothetical protein